MLLLPLVQPLFHRLKFPTLSIFHHCWRHCRICLIRIYPLQIPFMPATTNDDLGLAHYPISLQSRICFPSETNSASDVAGRQMSISPVEIARRGYDKLNPPYLMKVVKLGARLERLYVVLQLSNAPSGVVIRETTGNADGWPGEPGT